MTAKPTVCFVSRKWPPAMGGMETYAHRLSGALEDHADVIRIVLPGRTDGSVPGAFQLLRFGVGAGLRLLFAQKPADVIHVADMASWPLALCARIRSRRSRIVLSAHGTDVSYGRRSGVRGNVYGAYLRLGASLLGSARVIANSAATAACTASYGFSAPEVIALAAEGPSVTRKSAKRTVLFSGRLVPLKGCRWFIENVLPRLPDDIGLEVAGTPWDAEEVAALNNPRVTRLGLLDQPELWQAYADSLCVAVPNIKQPTGQFEGFGLVAAEAAVAGGVVLAARHGGLVEAVLDGESGFLLPEGEAEAWAEKIQEIASWSEEKRKEHVAGTQAKAAAFFTWDRVARETLAVYGLEGGTA